MGDSMTLNLTVVVTDVACKHLSHSLSEHPPRTSGAFDLHNNNYAVLNLFPVFVHDLVKAHSKHVLPTIPCLLPLR